jgi:hypothetical protein
LLLAAFVVPTLIRARSTSCRSACLNGLRQIDGAKQQWALENKKQDSDTPTRDEIRVYIRNSEFPVCSAGGTCQINRVCEAPTCSIGGEGHSLPP